MSKTPIEGYRERYNEIRREILQISESYVLITGDKLIADLNAYETEHMGMLYYELRELVKELKTLFLHGVEIPMIYRKMVNNLMYNIKLCTDAEIKEEIRKDKTGEILL